MSALMIFPTGTYSSKVLIMKFKIKKVISKKKVIANVDFSNSDVQRTDYKTFRGMITQLKKINKLYNKWEIKGNFTIQLPMKD